MKITRDRILKLADQKAFGDAESRFPSSGYGVWRVSIGKDGSVRALRLLRVSGQGRFTEVVEPWLLKTRYRARDQAWTGLIKVSMHMKDHE